MDVNLNPQVPLQQNSQTQQSAPNATAQANATTTLQTVPDVVVTAATENSQTSAREEDALRRQDRSVREQGVSSLQDFEVRGLTTRVGFDAEADRVFLEILLPESEEVLRRIPSENLIEFLQTRVDPVQAEAQRGVQALDRSI